MKKIITISREFGSGGRTIGKKVAQALGYAYYDKEIVEQVSQRTGYAKEFVEKHGEYAPSANKFSYFFLGRDISGISNDDYIWNCQRAFILEVADKEPCVIVGRCSDYILKDRKDALHVFIHAPMEKRVERVLTLYGETKEDPVKRLETKDKTRRINYQYFTDREWGMSQNYHISLDSGEIGIDRCVEILVSLAKE